MFRDSISKFFKVDSLIGNLTGYVETRIELLKIEVTEDISRGLSNIIVFLLLAFVFAVFIVFISVAIALAIGENIGGFAGFAIVSGFYLLLGGVLVWSRSSLIKKLDEVISAELKKKKTG